MIRIISELTTGKRAFALAFWLCLMLLSGSSGVFMAQSAPTEEPLPLGMQRTEADIAAAAQWLQDARPADVYVPMGQRSHVSQYVIPRTIKVAITGTLHCSVWLEEGQPVLEVIELPFIDYVKQVLPNEWKSSWDADALMSGAMAAKTFAWWRMTLTTQRPGGADVVDNTCDQVFIRNSQKPSTNAAVDATWHYRMSNPSNRIPEVHYLSTDEYCEQSVLSPCMGQWGTQYMAEEGATWDQILHHYFDPIDINPTSEIPVNSNVIQNGSYDADMLHWQMWGNLAGLSTANRVLQFYRPADAPAAVIFQDVNYQVYPNTQLRLKLSLGNSSNTPKIVNVHVHSTTDWDGALSCQFTIHPNQPLLDYVMWGTSSTYFGAIRVEISAASPDGAPAYLIDDVSLQYRPDDTEQGDSCVEPAPGKPTILAPTLDKDVAKKFTIELQAGESNYRPGYAPKYHVQIATDNTFNNILWHNDGNYSPSTTIANVTLPTGQFFIRARQFDGIDRWSVWKQKTFIVRNFPDVPTLLAPSGALDGNVLVFSWTDGAETDSYRVLIYNEFKQLIFKRMLSEAEASCNGSTCSVPLHALNAPLLDGRPHAWKLKAYNSQEQSKSTRMWFTPEMPGIPHLRAPASGSNVNSSTVFRWDKVHAADFYRFQIKLGGAKIISKKLLPANLNCASGKCEITIAQLGGGLTNGVTYKWQVRALRAEPRAVSKTPKWSFTYSEAAAMTGSETSEENTPLAPPQFRN